MNSAPSPLILAADIGGTHVELGLVDERGRVLQRATHKTAGFVAPESFVEALCAARTRFEAKAEGPIRAIGIGAPNGHHARGTIEFAPNLNWPGQVPLAAMVQAATGLPVALDNDANAAALGEARFGTCVGLDDFVVVTLGTGIGAGLVSGGQLVRGATGLAGEFGHVTAVPGGRLCACGRKGCIEAYVSGRALGVTYAELARDQGLPVSLMDARALHAAALAGDALALATFERSGELFAGPLADLTMLLAPARIVFLGGLTQAGDILLEPIKRHYAGNLPTHTEPVSMLFSPLSDASLAGAAALALGTTFARD